MKAIINMQEYQKRIDQDNSILVDFHVDWCGIYVTLLPKLRIKFKDDLIVRKINEHRDPTKFTRA